MARRKPDIIIKDTHRGLWYEDGVLKRVLEAGRYELPEGPEYGMLGQRRHARVEVALVDIRERELTIKGQEILTSDKVALRVSIIVQFRVTDPKAAMHEVENFEERLYSDVQLAARRSLASMTLEEILRNRNQLSEEILHDVTGPAARYGITISRADVKDLVFPGNLQEIMNRVLAAERNSQAQLVEARTKAEVQKIEAQTRADALRVQAEAERETGRLAAEAGAEQQRVRSEGEADAVVRREKVAATYDEHPALLRLAELETIRELSRVATARIYIGFDKHAPLQGGQDGAAE